MKPGKEAPVISMAEVNHTRVNWPYQNWTLHTLENQTSLRPEKRNSPANTERLF